MKSPREFVRGLVDLIDRAKTMPLGQAPLPVQAPSRPADRRKVLLFSPHPDDEVVIGGLAWRLAQQSGWEVANVAVTLGSNPARRSARLEELQRCCRYLGFRVIQTGPGGLERINPRGRVDDPKHWGASVERIAEILGTERPHVICFPHAKDWNSTHIGTHGLLIDALGRLGREFGCYTVETEFWGAMDDPNLMVESSAEDLGELITALTFHVGEVRRNPYHLRLPAWMMDNVRRGCELVGGQGGASPDFLFATLYRIGRWTGGRLDPAWTGGRFLGRQEDPGSLFDA